MNLQYIILQYMDYYAQDEKIYQTILKLFNYKKYLKIICFKILG